MFKLIFIEKNFQVQFLFLTLSFLSFIHVFTYVFNHDKHLDIVTKNPYNGSKIIVQSICFISKGAGDKKEMDQCTPWQHTES